MKREITEEFEALTNPVSEEQVETENTPSTNTSAPELAEYYLGDKANKLPLNAEFAFTEGGKTVKAPLSTVLNHYRQRADLDKKYESLKADRAAWEQERGDIETYKTLKAKWEALQNWSEQKPEEFQTIWDLYQNKDKHLLQQKAGDPQSTALVEELAALKQELSGLKEFKSSFEKQRELEEKQKALNEVEQEASDFQKEWPEIKLDQVDEKGISLKHQIMVYGLEKGIPDFESAALKFLKGKLLEVASQRSRAEAVKGLKQEAKIGVIARSSTPFGNGQNSQVNPKMSKSELMKLARSEYESLLNG